jgi:hypothetical protein
MPDRFATMTQERPNALSVTADALHMLHIEWRNREHYISQR